MFALARVGLRGLLTPLAGYARGFVGASQGAVAGWLAWPRHFLWSAGGVCESDGDYGPVFGRQTRAIHGS